MPLLKIRVFSKLRHASMIHGGRTAEFNLGKENQKLSVCKTKCENDPDCTAMQYTSSMLRSLWHDKDIGSVSDSANASISNSLVDPFSFHLCHYFTSFVKTTNSFVVQRAK